MKRVCKIVIVLLVVISLAMPTKVSALSVLSVWPVERGTEKDCNIYCRNWREKGGWTSQQIDWFEAIDIADAVLTAFRKSVDKDPSEKNIENQCQIVIESFIEAHMQKDRYLVPDINAEDDEAELMYDYHYVALNPFADWMVSKDKATLKLITGHFVEDTYNCLIKYKDLKEHNSAQYLLSLRIYDVFTTTKGWDSIVGTKYEHYDEDIKKLSYLYAYDHNAPYYFTTYLHYYNYTGAWGIAHIWHEADMPDREEYVKQEKADDLSDEEVAKILKELGYTLCEDGVWRDAEEMKYYEGDDAHISEDGKKILEGEKQGKSEEEVVSEIHLDRSGDVKLSKSKLTMFKGDEKKLTLKNAKAKEVKWSSSDKKVATVKKGKIKAKKKGTVTITATYKGKKYKCTVKIKKKKAEAAYIK